MAGSKGGLSGGAAARLMVAAAFTLVCLVPSSTESAVANGDTRTIVLSNQHTGESGSFTFMVNGVYDQATLNKLNWFLRDWRLNEPTKMDPHLFDILWEVYRESGSTQPIDVLSGYRSPQTNAMLRRRSRQVAAHSMHMQGKAVDAHFVDVSTARIRDIAMRMEAGGVGFYPSGLTPWVHIDTGAVRYWPRMSRAALTRLFPDGKTVFIPSDGKTMPGYEQARAEIEARGAQVQVARASSGGVRGLFAWLFGARGGGEDDAEERNGQEAIAGNARGGRGSHPPVEVADAGPEAVARAKRNLPTGPAYASAIEPPPAPPVKPPEVAAATEPNAASGAEAQLIAPLPPRRPAGLDAAIALAQAPTPPARPAELILASMTDEADVAAARRDLLPQAITSGIDRAPTGALALAEGLSLRSYDDGALLARAAEIPAPLPPMPIPDAGSTAAAPSPGANGGAVRTATLKADRLARMFGGLPFGVFKKLPVGPRGPH